VVSLPAESPAQDFAATVIRGLAALGPCGPTEADLTLELGLSLWMNHAGTDLHAARATMLAIRHVLLEVGGMDSDTEPVPLLGLAPRLDALNLAAYLGDLVIRAARSAQCEPALIAERAIEHLGRSHPVPTPLAGRSG
jgi:hypothetical protein